MSHVVNLGWLTTYGVDPTNTSVVIQGYKWPADGYGIQATGGLILGDTDNGTALVMPRENVLLVNGANNNVAAGTGSYARIYGPTGAFSISGFPGGVDGRILHVLNSVSQIMTIKNLTGSSAGNQIITLTGADVVLRAGPSFATFIYSAVDSAWILASTN